MDMTTVQAWLPTAIAAGSLGLIWWDVRRRANIAERRTAEIEGSVRRSLYRDDGSTIYIPRGECERDQGACRQSVCSKIDAMQATLAAMDAKRDAQRDIITNQIQSNASELAKLAGKVEQFLSQQNKS